MVLRDKLKKIYGKLWVLVSRLRMKLWPDHSRSQLQLAHAEVQQGAWSLAIDLASQVLRKDPENARAHQILSLAYAGQGDRTQAFSAILTAIQLDPKICWFYQDLGKLYLAEEENELAVLAFEQAVALEPNNGWLTFTLGEGLVKQGRWQEAIEPLQRSIQLNPVFPWSYFYVAEAYLSLGEIESATSYYHKAMMLGPDIQYFKDALAYAKNFDRQDEQVKAFCQKAKLEDAAREQQSNTESLLRKPRVLLITPHPPYPPQMGSHSRMFYEMKALNEKTDLVVVSLSFSKLDFPIEQDLAQFSQLALVMAIGDYPPNAPYPKPVHRYSSHRMNQLLTVLNTANFDWIVMDFIYTSQYRQFFPNSFSILSEHNIESQLFNRHLTAPGRHSFPKKTSDQIESKNFEAYENQVWSEVSLVTVVSALDQAIIHDRVPHASTMVVNNGANTRQFKLLKDNPAPRILFMGTLNYHPNVDGITYFIQEILPLVWEKNPNIVCWIAGADPLPKVYELAKNDDRIQVFKNPERMDDLAEQCCCTIVPLRIGGGTRIKIVHSLAMGLPVISTSLGCEGLEVFDNKHLLVRDQPTEFAEAVLDIIQNESLRERLRVQGRDLVEQQYDWEDIFNNSVEKILSMWRDQNKTL